MPESVIPKSLEKKRDTNYPTLDVSKYSDTALEIHESVTNYNKIDGFNAGVRAVLESAELRGLVEANEFYAEGRVDHDTVIEPIISGRQFPFKMPRVYGCYARKAITNWNKFIGDREK